ncbi:hypothetical protein SLS58_011079, partial [Diplodia intermedia]
AKIRSLPHGHGKLISREEGDSERPAGFFLPAQEHLQLHNIIINKTIDEMQRCNTSETLKPHDAAKDVNELCQLQRSHQNFCKSLVFQAEASNGASNNVPRLSPVNANKTPALSPDREISKITLDR